MHLPGPVRAAVGLVASASSELRKLPDRAIELPMLAVSTALQMSLRAQQRYAQLAAKGDEVLSRGPAGDEPPPWATFDEPVPAEELHRSALAQLDSLLGDAGESETGSAGRMFEELFGVDDPSRATGAADAAGAADAEQSADDGPTATVTPISDAERPSRTAGPRKATPRKATARKSTARKSTAGRTTGSTSGDDAAPPVQAAQAAKKSARKTAKKATRKTTARSRGAAATTGADTHDNGVADAVKSEPDTSTVSGTAPAPDTDEATGRGKSVSPPRDRAPSRFDAAGDDDGTESAGDPSDSTD
ncbi:hypothetical protein [Jatrophihabitans fulvus]